ncbi:response regulator [Bacillus sp. 3255]|uniref:response regulator transcription factor n=1 Tax=Bacillus sp. 3255 TaxID=2817904 RepID=UPI00285B4371|nr:response regulator [Bacillus sp. 3255]MDR6878521.1 two-component system response regulator YesN [Bacillus sp. 3255]
MLNQLLLVEDEPLFRKGLAKMIADSGTNWQVCGEAENGLEAESLIAGCQPDLVITDIRMPLMDGLELLKRMKVRFPDITFVVITGYQDFQYAQTALRYGAFDLLIKPCSKQDIYDVLDKVEIALQERHAKLRQKENEHQLLLENTLRGMFLRFPYRFEVAAELEHAWIGTRLYVLSVTDFYPAHKQYHKRDVPVLQFAMLNIISEVLDAHGVAGKLLLIEYGRFALLLPQAVDGLHVGQAASATVQRLLGIAISPQPAGTVMSLNRLADLYEAAVAGNGLPAEPEQEPSNGPAGEYGINRVRQQLVSNQIAAYIAAGQIELLKQYLEMRLLDVQGMPPETGKIEALSLSFALQDTARKQFEGEHEPYLLTERIGKLHSLSSGDEVYAWVRQELELFLGSFLKWQDKYSETAVKKAARYMEEHYAEPLPLQLVASQVHLNATYFSHLFKKETGRSFVDYLIELRMEKAKQLLANTDLKITEISGMIGYDLPNYFAKLFKQTTGLTPKDYRKQMQGTTT